MHSNVSDDELLNLIRAGDESAFVALYRRKQAVIYRFALRMSGSESVAEDVTQEVFLHLMRGNGNFDSARGSFQSYLFGIARNQVLRRIERDRTFRLVSLDNSEDGNDAPLTEALIVAGDLLGDLTRWETIESVRQAVLALPAHYREVVVLCDLHEISYQEAAEILGCAIGTVRSRLHRARAILVERLQTLNAAQTRPAAAQILSESFI
ncbi:MAG: RNA polymerase sigma factor [Acidobacteriota bacterium]|nr:RNA polymerase sigma factor [Acidobacteriota bacterium]